MSVPEAKPWDGACQHKNSQAVQSSWDELQFSKAWTKKGYPGSGGPAGLGMSRPCGRSKVWRSSWNSLPSKIIKVAFPPLLEMLRRERWQGTLLCSIPNCSMPGAAPEPCPWNSGILSFYFLPMHSHFPEEQNSHLILVAQLVVTLSPLWKRQESSDVGIAVGNSGPINGSLILSQLQVPVLNPQILLQRGKCLWSPMDPLLNFSTACSLGKLEMCSHSISWMTMDPWNQIHGPKNAV